MSEGGQEKSRARKTRELLYAYLKTMAFAFTGGSATLPLLIQQLTEKYKLIDRDKLIEYFALGQALPGVISLNAGILIGREVAGWPGALAAIAGCVLPAFFGMLLITLTYTFISGWGFISGVIGGIRAASIALILYNAILIMGMSKNVFYVVLALLAFVCVFFLGWNVIIVILLCGAAGVLRRRVLGPGKGDLR
ncbi:MAG: chromate transporter [Ruminococcaceae bacterium]|nr:chromate transporter [Oscillospiraceae bacterium]